MKLFYFLLLLGVELGVVVGVDLVICLFGASTVGVLGSTLALLLGVDAVVVVVVVVVGFVVLGVVDTVDLAFSSSFCLT